MRDGSDLIGRRPAPGSARSLVLDHPTVSQRHAELVVLQGTYFLTDLGSRNGTWRVRSDGQEPIEADYVAPDEPLRFGEVQTTLEQLFDDAVSCRGS